ncbi:C6 zinc finger domain protein [Penicillium cataractarum]|uniref:C6 zinc finger domain protein n=1 Tax=Penicillium cataractarum TaxID=2100454 RepID=A0A9W9VHM1_9EURO|nr:C6 zinc finger domain protein [Penicillium cataractarum]KAJ5381084.1 C6 zinc finger domain protein [Penicillium cataractarum]
MVYRGKPSPGCAVCRARRLLCDRGRPSCSQCLRANRECSGYQDLQALRIHDQSQEIVAKAQAQARRKSPKTSPRTSPKTSPKPSSPVQSVILSVPMPAAIPASMDEWAMSYIFKLYVGTNQSRGLLAYLPNLLSDDPSPALQATIKAVGLAGMSRVHSLPKMMYSAGVEYSTALIATNRALQDSTEARSDSTLAAVVLLSTYEMITCQNAASGSNFMSSWSNHVRGATKLLELRGTEQMKSHSGQAMFGLVRMQIKKKLLQAFNNIFTREGSSPELIALSRTGKPRRDPDSQSMEDFYNIVSQLADLSIEGDKVFTGEYSSAESVSLINEALHLDADLESWALSVNPIWRCKSIEAPVVNNTNDPQHYPLYYGRRYHAFHNVALASMWTYFYQTRIIVNGIIQATCNKLLWQDTAHNCRHTLEQSIAVSKQMLEDMCASVPYYFTSGETGLAGLMRLTWPLFVAADCAVATPEEKNWLQQTLEKIEKMTGSQQALAMSRFLKQGFAVPFIPGNAGRTRSWVILRGN